MPVSNMDNLCTEDQANGWVTSAHQDFNVFVYGNIIQHRRYREWIEYRLLNVVSEFLRSTLTMWDPKILTVYRTHKHSAQKPGQDRQHELSKHQPNFSWIHVAVCQKQFFHTLAKCDVSELTDERFWTVVIPALRGWKWCAKSAVMKYLLLLRCQLQNTPSDRKHTKPA